MTDLRLRWLLAQERGEEFEGLDGELDGLARLLLLARARRYEPEEGSYLRLMNVGITEL